MARAEHVQHMQRKSGFGFAIRISDFTISAYSEKKICNFLLNHACAYDTAVPENSSVMFPKKGINKTNKN